MIERKFLVERPHPCGEWQSLMDALHPRQLERLHNAAVYFASCTKYCGTAKLFRLLYLFDVQHFQLTGVPATGESYAAYDFGPAPVRLFEFLPDNIWRTPLSGLLDRASDQSIDFGQVCWSAAPKHFDDDAFSPMQLEFLANLAQAHSIAHYRDIDLSAVDNGAWEATWYHGVGKGELIDFARTLRANDPKTPLILELHREEQARLASRRPSKSAGGHAAHRR